MKPAPRDGPGAAAAVAVWDEFVARSGLADPDLASTVLALSRIPYGRPSSPTALQVVREWRGTCSSKHLLLRDLVGERWPSTGVQLWHRVYWLTPELAEAMWGPDVAAAVPLEGLTDVHNYATVDAGGGPVVVDVTFPLADWDGRSPLEVASGPGQDQRAGPDFLAEKRDLVAAHCDPAVREPFIAALSIALGAQG